VRAAAERRGRCGRTAFGGRQQDPHGLTRRDGGPAQHGRPGRGTAGALHRRIVPQHRLDQLGGRPARSGRRLGQRQPDQRRGSVMSLEQHADDRHGMVTVIPAHKIIY
jgi:hypothetical protein